MGDHLDKKQQELKEIQDELQTKGLSRRKFLNRLQAVGVGFGAAFVMGVRNADALGAPDPGVNLTSTNPALDDIIAEGRGPAGDELDADGKPIQLAQYARYYRRGYSRGYARYGRYGRYARYYQRYNRYARYYQRYNRYYRRGYSRYY